MFDNAPLINFRGRQLVQLHICAKVYLRDDVQAAARDLPGNQ
jgi:hypothetical protein